MRSATGDMPVIMLRCSGSTGEQHSVREFVEIAARELGIEIDWRGSGVKEEGVVSHIDSGSAGLDDLQLPLQQTDIAPGKVLVRIDPRYFRPTEVETLLGDPGKAKEKLGWVPTTGFGEMVTEMVRSDLKEAHRDEFCRQKGFWVNRYNE